MNTTSTMKRFLLYITASLSVLLMVFGIGLSSINAATPSDSSNLQPASGAAEFRAEDGSTPTAMETAHAEDGSAENAEAAHGEEGEEADSGIIGMFGINWKLLLAQLVNFGIVVFVLWKWVFKPVTAGLSERTSKIENSLKDAEKIAKDRETFETWKQGEMGTVRSEAAAIITQAKQQAEVLKSETLQKTTEEQNRIIEQGQKRLEQEKASMLESAKSELADIVVQATSTILKEKINSGKDKELIDDALKKAQS